MAATTDLAQIQHLDWQPACDVINCRHGHPKADHVAHLACGCTTLLCPACTRIVKAARRANLWAPKAACRHCGRIYHDVTTRQLYVTIKPL